MSCSLLSNKCVLNFQTAKQISKSIKSYLIGNSMYEYLRKTFSLKCKYLSSLKIFTVQQSRRLSQFEEETFLFSKIRDGQLRCTLDTVWRINDSVPSNLVMKWYKTCTYSLNLMRTKGKMMQKSNNDYLTRRIHVPGLVLCYVRRITIVSALN